MILPDVGGTLLCGIWVSYKYEGGGWRFGYNEGCSDEFFVSKVLTSIDGSSEFLVAGRETEVQVNLGINRLQTFPHIDVPKPQEIWRKYVENIKKYMKNKDSPYIWAMGIGKILSSSPYQLAGRGGDGSQFPGLGVP